MPEDMLEKLKRRVAGSRLGTTEIAERARVSRMWLWMVLNGKIENPSYKRVQAVIDACKR